MTMKRQRLAGYGRTAAYISAGSLLVFFFLQQFGGVIATAMPGLYVPSVIVFDLALWLWIAALAIVGFDLERLAHPAASTRGLQVARWLTVVAVVMPALLGIGQIISSLVLMPISYLLIFACVGISLVIYNLGGGRTELLNGVLPWLGIAAGMSYIIAGIGFGTLLSPFGMSFFPIGFNVLLLGQTLFIAWAIWLGVKLSRSKAESTALPVVTGRVEQQADA